MVLEMRSDAPYKSAADIIKAKMPPKCGESGTGIRSMAGMLEETLGLKIISVRLAIKEGVRLIWL